MGALVKPRHLEKIVYCESGWPIHSLAGEASLLKRRSPLPVLTASRLHLRQILWLNLHQHTRPFFVQDFGLDKEGCNKTCPFSLAIVVTDSVPTSWWLVPVKHARDQFPDLDGVVGRCDMHNLDDCSGFLPRITRLIDLGFLVIHRTQHLTFQNICYHVSAAVAVGRCGSIRWIGDVQAQASPLRSIG